MNGPQACLLHEGAELPRDVRFTRARASGSAPVYTGIFNPTKGDTFHG